ncbi:MAG: orotidine-5'-phosphate decarboxylase [Anaplasma ovis]|uniref:Orotidine 5'-phosphate decarboxylase n=1 Tax=Anaplasma ovis str. Haibei TaxID=1248439 RepID=A0A2Z2L7S7_9RICK|nr:orotidine-5'-phosphate decarboxylase [Anaplasma ovis]ASI47578.1 orotidine 5'-phosphate decarboxylase [Anaplasma ovis str. Haibei]
MRSSPIICALDMMDIARALEVTRVISGKVAMVKLGLEFFTAYGIAGVQKVIELGVPVFLDLKLHDIPNTVVRAIHSVRGLNIAMLTIHVSGGRDMMRAAADALSETNILLAGVTILTSIGGDDFTDFGVQGSLESHVIRLVDLAVSAGLRAVVCSAHEIGAIRSRHPDVTLVVPGIRFDSGVDDQKRTKTPIDALSDGANYLVVGRPITQSPDPLAAIDEILRSIKMY